jgi:DNA-3-methyladenine glycosylase
MRQKVFRSILVSLMNGFQPLPREFYLPSARRVAPELLGHFLLRRTDGGYSGGPIVETEAYVRGDAACHGEPGPTPRNRVMFEEPGHSYVYFIYGCHFCFNTVCCPAGIAEAVLIRAIEVRFDEDFMRQHRTAKTVEGLTNGPGKLCQALQIDRKLNGLDLCKVSSELFIAENPDVKAFRKMRGPRVTGKRIGITKAASLPLRFYLDGSAFVS